MKASNLPILIAVLFVAGLISYSYYISYHSEANEKKASLTEINSYTTKSTTKNSTKQPLAKNKQAIAEIDTRSSPVPLNLTDKIKDWKKATSNQKLALCIGISEVANKQHRLKLTAIDVHNCIDDATRGLDATNDVEILDIANLCIQELSRH